VRVAAVGDIHIFEGVRYGAFDRDRLHEDGVDLLLLAGDLTNEGTVQDAIALVRVLPSDLPIVAVLGNHDYASDQEERLIELLQQFGVHTPGLDFRRTPREGVVLDIKGTKVGIAGVTGFGGGFGNHRGAFFGERMQRDYMRYTQFQADILEDQLRDVGKRDADTRIALVHYAPCWGTCKGEPPEVQAWLGSSKLGVAASNGLADIIFHGHAHRGTYAGSTHGIKVRNVAADLVGRGYALFNYSNGRWSDIR
jgi:predicted phosphodiesterase